eukprot:6276758-Amphidinium_carterae.1
MGLCVRHTLPVTTWYLHRKSHKPHERVTQRKLCSVALSGVLPFYPMLALSSSQQQVVQVTMACLGDH